LWSTLLAGVLRLLPLSSSPGRVPCFGASLLIILILGQIDFLQAQTRTALAISRPQAGETVRGTYTFAASVNSSGGIATVEFDIGSKRLGTRTHPPFQVTWNTAHASDGSYALQVVAHDVHGQVISSAQHSFTVNNQGNSLTVISPNLDEPLRGIVKLSIHGSDRQRYPALWMLNIDGRQVGVVWTDNTGRNSNTVTAQIDTTEFPNGTHELYVGMYSDYWPAGQQANKSWYNWRGGFDQVITIDNGHALMAIVANYLHVYLQPGGQSILTCHQHFTNGTSGSCVSPTYASSDSRVVTVSSTGKLNAGSREGFANITVTDAGKSTQVYVWVRNSLNVPHFSGSGEMLNTYKPGRSLFVVAPFTLQASDLSGDANLLRKVRKAGINAISQGFYSNPRKLHDSYRSWRQYYDTDIAPAWAFAAKNGLHILATGDEVCRNIGGDAWWTLNWPSGKSAVQHAFRSLAASRVAISVDMVDEASMLWGPTPQPPGLVGGPKSFNSISCSGGTCTVSWPNNPVNGSRFPSGVDFALTGSQNPGLNTAPGQLFNATNIGSDSFDFSAPGAADGTFTRANDPNLEFLWWAGKIRGCPSAPCNPPVPNDALVQITNWLHSVQPSVPISWPALGQASVSVQANWMGPNSISDYASHYWIPFKLRHTYTWSQGIQELGYWMSQAFYQRQPFMRLDRPQLVLDSISGPAYVKNARGAAYYRPPADALDQPGVSGSAVTATMMTAAALGAAGVRLYYFENSNDAGNRAAAPSGAYFQTGASPTADDPTIQDIWQGISSAANALTGPLAPYILGTELSSPAYGPDIITAARQGPNGRMLMIVNDNDWERTISVSFAPYRYGTKVNRYRISADGINGPSPAPSSGETITLKAGETVAYLFSP
jgi:hypothetical protein